MNIKAITETLTNTHTDYDLMRVRHKRNQYSYYFGSIVHH